ncbi:MAG: FimV/HubP family polar landmark protein [Pseudomonadota bacterium]
MVRVRKLVLAIAAASALTSGMAHALGLGEVSLKSALNQPLVAEIELLEVRELTPGELIPTLASPEEFTKAGVDRQYFLTDLKFTPVLKPNGKSVLRVTSSKPVREPYLNFLVELLWPNGRLLREYTLLLDPPLYTPTVAAAPQLPVAAPRTQAPSTSRSTAPAAPTAPASRPAAASSLAGNEYKTTGSDTLWEIAERVNAGGTVHQTMLAIQDLNPQAFIDGNINRLKSGQVLRLPDEQQVKNRARGEAVAQVTEQNTAWREGRTQTASSRQVDATKRDQAGAAPSQAEVKDNLKLVAAESGKSTSGNDKGGTGDSKALSDQLAVTKESLDSTRRENDELKSRMGDLQSQLDKLQRLIQLKDDQLAKMQADAAAQGQAPSAETPGAVPAPATPTLETPAAVPTPVPAPAQPAAEPGAAAPVDPAVEPAGTPPAATDFNYDEPAATPAPDANTQQPASEPAVAVVPKAPAPAVEAPKQTAPVAPAAEPVSLIDEVLGNTMLLAILGGAALVLLLIALMILSRRNAQKESELQHSLSEHDGNAHFDDVLDTGSSSDAFDSAQELAPAHTEERVTAQTGDVLGEADIYIAYGRFNQAAELLQNAINDEPNRSDLRLKLMEVQGELGDREGFARQESELREIGGAAGQVQSLKSRYPAMAGLAGAGLAGAAAADDLDAFSLDDLTLDEPVAQPIAEADDGFDLSLDDLEADLDRDLQASAAQGSAGSTGFDFSKSSADSHDDLGFDLSLDDEPALQAPSDDLADFSLDLDSEPKAAAFDEDDFLLSLDDEPAPASRNTLADADLSLDDKASDFELPADFDLSLSDEETPAAPVADSFAAQLDDVTAELDQLSANLDQSDDLGSFTSAPAPAPLAGSADDDEFDFLSGTDETATKLDLARAYIDMGDTEGARDILDEVMTEGSDGQQSEARELLARLA